MVKHPEKIRAARSRWRRKHPEKCRRKQYERMEQRLNKVAVGCMAAAGKKVSTIAPAPSGVLPIWTAAANGLGCTSLLKAVR